MEVAVVAGLFYLFFLFLFPDGSISLAGGLDQ